MMNKILVVCVGNICRSPMAEYVLRSRLDGIAVASAGLDALEGYAADPDAIRVSAEHGLDITPHRARRVNLALVNEAELILTMEATHMRELMRRYPTSHGKVFRLGEAEDFDVPDPYRKPIERFHDSFGLIVRGVDVWTSRIKALA
jgi:protein-tyrosine phosphatase